MNHELGAGIKLFPCIERRYELAVSFETAKALGQMILSSMMACADGVIQEVPLFAAVHESAIGPFEKCRRSTAMSVHRRPEVIDGPSERRV